MQDIVDLLVANYEISKEEAQTFLEQLFSSIEKGLSADELTKVKDFGSFKLTHIQERESIDVNTKEKIVIPAHRRISFLPAQVLKDIVNKPFVHFETTPLNDGVFEEGISQDTSSENEDEENGDDDDVKIDQDATPPLEASVERDSSAISDTEESNRVAENIEEREEEPKDELPTPIVSPLPTPEDKIDYSASPEKVFEDEEPETSSKKYDTSLQERSVANSSEKSKPKKSEPKKTKSRGKLRRYILRWDFAIALFMIFAVGFAFNYYLDKNNNAPKHGVEESDIPKPIEEATPATIENSTSETDQIADSIESVKALEPVKTVKMSPGRTLRLIALDKFGDREFWVYIYMKNKDKIKNPDVVPVGIVLELPFENEYPIDPNDSTSVAKAKQLGDEVMKTYGS